MVIPNIDMTDLTVIVLIIFLVIGGAAIFYSIVKPLLFPPDMDED